MSKKTGLQVAPKKKTVRKVTIVALPSKRRKKRSRGFLSDMMNPTMATNGAKNAVAAVGGGYASIGINKMLPSSWGTGARLAVAFGLGFLGHTVLGAPNLSSGLVGGMVAQNNPANMLNDDSFVNGDVFAEEPEFISEETGNPVYLADDGNWYER